MYTIILGIKDELKSNLILKAMVNFQISIMSEIAVGINISKLVSSSNK
jgi:hypothetical protein